MPDPDTPSATETAAAKETAPDGSPTRVPGPRPRILLAMVLAIATSGLVYELCMAAVGSYLLGDTVHRFSLVIGTYLSALGVGAYLSRFVDRRLAMTFIDIEFLTALIGGLSSPLLMLGHSWVGAWEVLFYGTVGVVGTLVGLELPLLMRVLEHRLELKELLARALTVDYIGSLLGSLAFSWLLVPKLGLMRSSIVSGLMNAAVGLASTFALRALEGVTPAALWRARLRGAFVMCILLGAWLSAGRLTARADASTLPGTAILTEQTPYQRIVVTESRGPQGRTDLRLFLNGHLQFSSLDERRYHEALVHPVLALAERRQRVWIGGGGDGLAAREVLRHPDVERLTLVDLDPEMTALFSRHPRLSSLNEHAFEDSRLHVVNDDAFTYLRERSPTFDVAILDFPDPNSYALGKLYSLEFYRLLRARLAPRGLVVIQATSPFFARQAFWCIEATLRAAGFDTLPYRIFVPSFGDWGYILAGTGALGFEGLASAREQLATAENPGSTGPSLPRGLSYLTPQILRASVAFPPDSQRSPVAVNRLDNQALVGYYSAAWERFN
ncbi:MAG TPA: polyamine aminopropyltransferase [Polyangiaceae bacterium]|nr:polyamine aminopropyltransferase [Polyangiaceae bacterium]